MTEEEIAKVAAMTEGKSGAEIENIVNLAALQAVRKAIGAKLKNTQMTGAELIEFTSKHNEGQKVK